jgi:hypothetical protein
MQREFLGIDYFTEESASGDPANKSASKLFSAPFLVQIGKANRIYNRFLFVCLRLTR